MNPLSPEQREELRHVVLEVLAARHPTAQSLRAIRRLAEREVSFACSEDELESALAFWEPEHVTSGRDVAGSTAYWRPTAAGVLLVERGFRRK